MPSHLHKAYFNTSQAVDVLNVTHDVKRALRDSQILDGLLTVFVPGGAASVVLMENDPAIWEGFVRLITSFVPVEEATQRPVRKSGTGRNEAHWQASLLPSSITIPLKEGKLLLSPWQEVIVFDFDNRIARRELFISVMGEGAIPPGGGKK